MNETESVNQNQSDHIPSLAQLNLMAIVTPSHKNS